jgi:nickel/cobalt transporter (NiCoT) family protein
MFWQIVDDAPDHTRGKVMCMYAILIPANIAAWLWALLEFRNNPLLLSRAFLAYSFGLRHAFDADHIAAIDNITRKLMLGGRFRNGGGGSCRTRRRSANREIDSR